jgi:hypothetical protein
MVWKWSKMSTKGVAAREARQRRGAVAKAVKRPAAWHPPPGVKMSRNQVFLYRRRAVEQYAQYLGLDLRYVGSVGGCGLGRQHAGPCAAPRAGAASIRSACARLLFRAACLTSGPRAGSTASCCGSRRRACTRPCPRSAACFCAHAALLQHSRGSDARALPVCPHQGYTEMLDLNGTPYYYHTATKSVSWEHPLDAEYRSKLRGMRCASSPVCA